MASRRFFAYDPYDYYYTAPYHYPYPYPYYHHQQPAPARSVGGFFPTAANAEPAAAARAAARPRVGPRSVSIPVHFAGSDPEPERETARMPSAAAPRKRVPSVEEAAVRVQAAARGFMARRTVRAVREAEREAEEVAARVAREAEALRGDARARIAVGEALMRLLLRLDAVRGAREYRKRVTKRVLALQDAVDALELRPAVVEEPGSADTSAGVEMAEESDVATELPDAAEHGGETEPKTAAETDAEMEVDGAAADGEPDAEPTPDGVNLRGGDKPEDADAEGEWEMVTQEPTPAPVAASAEAAGVDIRRTADGGVDARKVMEMVAALCGRSAQQCAVIGALAERVGALERAVRRVEDAERRRRRGKKPRKEINNHSKCYSDDGSRTLLLH